VDLSPGHVRAYRKTFDLLIEAESYEDAQRLAHSLVGAELGPRAVRVFYEEIHSVGNHEPVVCEGDARDGVRRYAFGATMVARTDSFDRAVEGFNYLDGSFTTDDDGEEINFDAIDESPPVEGMMWKLPRKS
jgi:hypothetical protein